MSPSSFSGDKHSNSIEETKFLGTGFMLIKRNVFERMAKVYPELKFVPDQHINQSHDKEFDYHKTSNWNYHFIASSV